MVAEAKRGSPALGGLAPQLAATGRQGRRPKTSYRSRCAGPPPWVAEFLSRKQTLSALVERGTRRDRSRKTPADLLPDVDALHEPAPRRLRGEQAALGRVNQILRREVGARSGKCRDPYAASDSNRRLGVRFDPARKLVDQALGDGNGLLPITLGKHNRITRIGGQQTVALAVTARVNRGLHRPQGVAGALGAQHQQQLVVVIDFQQRQTDLRTVAATGGNGFGQATQQAGIGSRLGNGCGG